MGNLLKNWPAYVLLAGFAWFLTYVYIHSRKQEKRNSKTQTERNDNKKQ
jgi:hypothetical protein